jgi:hypothetical protein
MSLSISAQLYWWGNSRGHFRFVFHITTQQFNARSGGYYELMIKT